ncbi:MAG: outer membrane beta-barrel protein [Paludibacteraceae bacterium]|nr:outer membrane beta-barrel protein [Paludibacteraceae bacterium]
MRNKRYIVVIGLLLCLVGVNAQPRLKTPEYYLGAHGGATFSTVYFNPAEANMSPITNACVVGGNGGLVFRYAGHKYCHFQMEVNYMHRGWSSGNDSIGHNNRSLHYIEVPIFMNLNFGTDLCRWFFNLGPQIGYCIKDESQSIDHLFDWGLAAGTGFYVQTKHAGLYEFEVRFDYSFGGVYGTSILDAHRMASPMDLSINIGWLMPIRKQSAADKRRKETERRQKERERQQKELEQEYQIH